MIDPKRVNEAVAKWERTGIGMHVSPPDYTYAEADEIMKRCKALLHARNNVRKSTGTKASLYRMSTPKREVY